MSLAQSTAQAPLLEWEKIYPEERRSQLNKKHSCLIQTRLPNLLRRSIGSPRVRDRARSISNSKTQSLRSSGSITI